MSDSQIPSSDPQIVAYLCNWCSYQAADLAGTSRVKYPPNIRIIRVMCSGRVEPQLILKTFQEGADGVLIAGCHPGDCHYQEGNYKALRRYILLKKLLKQLGIEQDRLKLEWISASEGNKFAQVASEFTSRIRQLGPVDAVSKLDT